MQTKKNFEISSHPSQQQKLTTNVGEIVEKEYPYLLLVGKQIGAATLEMIYVE